MRAWLTRDVRPDWPLRDSGIDALTPHDRPGDVVARLLWALLLRRNEVAKKRAEGSAGVSAVAPVARAAVVVGVHPRWSPEPVVRVAAAEAGDRAVPVRLVAVWQYSGTATSWQGVLLRPGRDEIEQLARDALEHAARAPFLAALETELVLTEGSLAPALIAESQRATLLVVGAPPHDRWLQLVGRSVRAWCARRSSCPVRVVHLWGRGGHDG
jgi:nucleotide-binding universal stress UspA family protein